MNTDSNSPVVEEPIADPDLIEPAPARAQTQLWQPWTLIVPALLIIPLLCLAFAFQISPTQDEAVRQARPRATTQPTAAAPVNLNPQLRIFLPMDDAKLHRATVTGTLPDLTASDFESSFASHSRAALEHLFQAAPNYFPRGAKVQSVKLEQTEGGAAITHVSLNETFWNSDYWAMDSRTIMATEAIAHTVGDIYKQMGQAGDAPVLLLRDGHEMSVLGQFDAADPITPDPSVVTAH